MRSSASICAAVFLAPLLSVSFSAQAQTHTAQVCNPSANFAVDGSSTCWTIDTTYIGDRAHDDYRVTNRNALVNVQQRHGILSSSRSDAVNACAINPYAGIQSTLPTLSYTSAAVNIVSSSTNQTANLFLENVTTSDGLSAPSLSLFIDHSHPNDDPSTDSVFVTFNQNGNLTLSLPTDIYWKYQPSGPYVPVPNLSPAHLQLSPNLSTLPRSVQRLVLAAVAALPKLYGKAGSVTITPASSGLPVWTLDQTVQVATQLATLILTTPVETLPPLLTLTCDLSPVPYTSCQETAQVDAFGDFLTSYGAEYLFANDEQSLNSLLPTLRNWAKANALMTYPGFVPGDPTLDDTRIQYTLNSDATLPLAITWGMLRNDPAVSDADRTLIDGWTGKLLRFTTAPASYQNATVVGPNNHGYLKKSVEMAWAIVVGDDAGFADGVERYYMALNQMNQDGSLPWEVIRGSCGYSYQATAVQNLLMIAELAASQGYDLYSLNVNGVSIHTAIKFLLDAADNPSLIAPYSSVAPTACLSSPTPGWPFYATGTIYPFGNHYDTLAPIEFYIARFPDSPLTARLRNLIQPGGLVANRPFKDAEGGGNDTCLVATDNLVRVSLSGGSRVLPAAGGAGSVNLSSSSQAFSWTAESSASWLQLGNTSGTGSGKVAYTVQANTAATLRSATITAGNQVYLVDQPPAAVIAPQTGWWWDSKLNGTGFFIEYGGKAGSGMFVGGFLYDSAGNATWLVSTGQMTGSTYTSSWLNATGGQTLLGQYHAPILTAAGNLTITFTNPIHAVMIRPDGTQVDLQRFSFTTTPPTPPVAGTPRSGWWWAGPTLSGTGYGIEIQGNSVFIVAYVYNDAGYPVWYLASGNLTTPTSYVGTWDLYAGGPQLISPEGTYSAHKVNSATPMALTFTDAAHGTLTMGNVTIPITRFQEF